MKTRSLALALAVSVGPLMLIALIALAMGEPVIALCGVFFAVVFGGFVYAEVREYNATVERIEQ